MTAFEPPDFTYFAGLQFNPEIYENTLTDSAGTLPTNPTFNSVTTPDLFTDNIQRDTATTIHLFDAFPSVNTIIMGISGMFYFFGSIVITGGAILANGASTIAFGDGSVDAVVSGLLTYIQGSTAIDMTCGSTIRIEPTLAYIRSATTTIQNASSTILASFTSSTIGFTIALLQVVQGATTTMSLTEASTTFRNTTDWAVMSPVSILKDQLGNFRLYVTSTFTNITNTSIRIFSGVIECIPFSPATAFSFNFKTNTADDTITTSSIVASGGTTANTGTLTTTAAVQRLNTATLEVGNATPTAVNFKTNTAAPTTTTSSITASGGTTAGTGTLVIDAELLQLDTIRAGSMDFQTTAVGMTRLTQGNNGTSTGSMFEYGGTSLVYIIPAAGSFNVAFNTYALPNHGVVLIGAASGAGTLNMPSTQQRAGLTFIIYNQSLFTQTISTTGNRFTGPGLSRTGQTSFTMATNTAKIIRSFSSSVTTDFGSGLGTNMAVFPLT
jgi:hypothetical protein